MQSDEGENLKWDEEVRARVGHRLDVTAISSLLVALPRASGELALATTCIRYIKSLNPRCFVTLATRRSLIPIAYACPGIDAVVEMPQATAPDDSRRSILREFHGRADAVVCPINWPEDYDLSDVYTLPEVIWLLFGLNRIDMRDGLRPWLESKDTTQKLSILFARIQDELSFPVWTRTIVYKLAVSTSAYRVPTALARAFINLSIWRRLQRSLFRYSHVDASELAKRAVVLSTDAVTIAPPPRKLINALVNSLRRQGRIVLHNVRNPLQAAPHTIPLICSYDEFLALRAVGIPFVGWRSGLADLATAYGSKVIILYPAGAHQGRRAHSTFSAFNLSALNLATTCHEIVFRGDVEATARSVAGALKNGRSSKVLSV